MPKRIIVADYGGPETLQVVEEECAEPKRGEVRVRVLAAGVSLPDILAREGIHPETPRVPFTPGWDLIGVVDRLGAGVSSVEIGQIVGAMPISGAYTEFLCLPQRELVPVPEGLDPVEAVSLILNYITAYQMLHRTAKVKAGQRVLIHGAAGGVGTALLQLGRLAGLDMYGTCSARTATVVSDLGGIPIDYQNQDFVKEILRLTSDGVDAVFDGIGGDNLWRSREALRPGGIIVVYGFTSNLTGGRLAPGQPGGRHRFRESAILGWYIARNWFLPGKKRMIPYSIQWRKRLNPAPFREDLIALLDLLRQQKIKPLISQRFPLVEARQAHELLGRGGVIGKIVLVPKLNVANDEQLTIFRPRCAKRTNATVLPQLAPDAPWPLGQPPYGLVVRSRAAAKVPGRPRSSWSHIWPPTLEPRGDRHRGRQTLPRINARPRI